MANQLNMVVVDREKKQEQLLRGWQSSWTCGRAFSRVGDQQIADTLF